MLRMAPGQATTRSVISYAHHIVAEEFHVICGIYQKSLQGISCIDYADWPRLAINNGDVPQAVLLHLAPYRAHMIVGAARNDVLRHGRRCGVPACLPLTMRDPPHDIRFCDDADGLPGWIANHNELSLRVGECPRRIDEQGFGSNRLQPLLRCGQQLADKHLYHLSLE